MEVATDLLKSFGPAYFTGKTYIKGTTTNDSADSGNMGETLNSSLVRSSATTLTTATSKNVTSLTLTAGDWDVYGQLTFQCAKTSYLYAYSLSTTSATLSAADTISVPTSNQVRGSLALMLEVTGFEATDITVPSLYCPVSLATSTIIYLVANATFTSGTTKAYGSIFARRSSHG